MVPSDRLKPVRRVAQSKERDAARVLGDAQRALKDQESRLEQLRLFHREYQQRFDAAARGGMSAKQLQEFQAFMAKLHSAIEEQERAVEASRREKSRKKDHWQQRYTRSQAIGKVMERYRDAEGKQRERRDQKETDDHASRGGRRKT